MSLRSFCFMNFELSYVYFRTQVSSHSHDLSPELKSALFQCIYASVQVQLSPTIYVSSALKDVKLRYFWKCYT